MSPAESQRVRQARQPPRTSRIAVTSKIGPTRWANFAMATSEAGGTMSGSELVHFACQEGDRGILSRLARATLEKMEPNGYMGELDRGERETGGLDRSDVGI